MEEENKKTPKELENIKDLVNEGKIDKLIEIINDYLTLDEESNIDRLESIIEVLLSLHGGRKVISDLIKENVIDIPSLLKNLSRRDSLLRYSFLLVLRPLCKEESNLFLSDMEDLLQDEDPNVKEAALQLLIFMTGGEKQIADESLIQMVVSKLTNEKNFVVEKASQALISLGRQSPALVTKTLIKCTKEYADDEELKENIEDILKSIVSVEKIKEIVDIEEDVEEKDPSEILSERDIKKLEDSEKERFEKEPKKEKTDEKKEQIEDKLEEKEGKILSRALKLKKKELELKKKRLELETKEKELEEKEIEEREKMLKKMEELIQKEKKLSQVELELRLKSIEDKEKKIKEQEAKRIEEQIKKLEEEKKNHENS